MPCEQRAWAFQDAFAQVAQVFLGIIALRNYICHHPRRNSLLPWHGYAAVERESQPRGCTVRRISEEVRVQHAVALGWLEYACRVTPFTALPPPASSSWRKVTRIASPTIGSPTLLVQPDQGELAAAGSRSSR